MASYTPNLNLLMKDPVADGADTFNIETMLNQNWEKIDRQVLLPGRAAAPGQSGHCAAGGMDCRTLGYHFHHGRDPGPDSGRRWGGAKVVFPYAGY